jgi:DNA-binding FrmR family transcriptional regulator
MAQKSLIDVIYDMQSQGLNTNQITQSLQREGYPTQQIFDAMQLASQKMRFNQPIDGMGMPPPPMGGMGMMPQSLSGNMGMMPSAPHDDMHSVNEVKEIEELIEQIIDEKWKDIEADIQKVIDWKSTVETKFSTMQQQIDDLKGQMNGVTAALSGKMGEYDRNVSDVGTQLKAMEMAFSKIVPQFTENINELNRITRDLKLRK